MTQPAGRRTRCGYGIVVPPLPDRGAGGTDGGVAEGIDDGSSSGTDGGATEGTLGGNEGGATAGFAGVTLGGCTAGIEGGKVTGGFAVAGNEGGSGEAGWGPTAAADDATHIRPTNSNVLLMRLMATPPGVESH